MAEESSVVIDRGGSAWSDLWTKEDYLAIWLGFFLIFTCLIGYFYFGPKEKFTQIINTANKVQTEEEARAPFKTIAWYGAADEKSKLRASSGSEIGKFIGHWTKRPGSWSDNPLDSFVRSSAQANALNEQNMPKYVEAKAAEETALQSAEAAEAAAAAAMFQSQQLNDAALAQIKDWRDAKKKAGDAKRKTENKPFNYIPTLIGLCAFFALILSIGIKLMGQNATRFAVGFSFVFFISVIAYIFGGQTVARQYGIGAEAWGIVIGMLIANTIRTPKWVLPACQVEFFIKTGLVLLGAEVLFSKIVAIGIPGIFVAWVVTPIVLITTFIVSFWEWEKNPRLQAKTSVGLRYYGILS